MTSTTKLRVCSWNPIIFPAIKHFVLLPPKISNDLTLKRLFSKCTLIWSQQRRALTFECGRKQYKFISSKSMLYLLSNGLQVLPLQTGREFDRWVAEMLRVSQQPAGSQGPSLCLWWSFSRQTSSTIYHTHAVHSTNQSTFNSHYCRGFTFLLILLLLLLLSLLLPIMRLTLCMKLHCQEVSFIILNVNFKRILKAVLANNIILTK